MPSIVRGVGMAYKISRRKFLKLSSIAAFSPFVPLGQEIGPKRKAPTPVEFGAERRVPLRCRMCGQQCPAMGIVKGGKLIKMIANPNVPYAGICGRSRSTPAAVYNPDRLKYPLLRVGKRGEGKFKRITWEEALDRIAEVLKKYRKEAPEKVVYLPRFTSAAGIDKPFWHLYGTPNILTYADTCHAAGKDWGLGAYFGRPITPSAVWMDYPNAKFGVLAMRNPGGGLCVYQFGTLFGHGKRNGLRMVAVDVRYPNESIEGAGHKWLPIRPGTDPAFHLALAHVIVKKKGYDEGYLIKKTNACMLIDPETLEPFNPVIEEKVDPKTGKKKEKVKYLVWDEAQGRAVLKAEARKPALRGEFTVNGRKVVTAFEAICRALEKYTPQWAEKITTIPAAEIEAVAEELIKHKPRVFVHTGWYSERYANSLKQFHAIGLVDTLLGCWEKKGGIGGIPKIKLHGVLPKVPKPKALMITKYYQKKAFPFIIPKAGRRFVIEALRTGKPYEPKVLFAMGQNFIGGSGGSVEMLKYLDKVELIVCMTPFMDESCLYADIILPDTMFPERNEALHVKFKQSFPTVAMNMKAIEPPFEARPGDWVMLELAKRVLEPEEFEKYFGEFARGGWEYGWRKQLEGLEKKYPGLTLERLKKEGVWYGKQKYKIKKVTPTGEVEIFSLTFLKVYKKLKSQGHPYAESANPLPSWDPPFWWEEKKGQPLADDEFILTTGFSPLNSFTGGQTRDNPILRELFDEVGADKIWIHPEKARRLGIKDGDLVEVFPAHDPSIKATARVWVTPLVHPDAIFSYYSVAPGAFPKLKKFLAFMPEHGVNINHFSKLHFAHLHGGHATQDVIIKVRRV